ncbi:hypothetical protein HCY68_10735 [Acinetobacter radioresistens]|uniref:hypothetical protein n=1 Tax=Acinetobacter radioresistens TaxID=40216 RepID=UPI002004C1B7|nr:hypothetical protein [Acinetobacter radioresistens]MCK4093483.1 hypothetical protein [Acinetobacter radioresistens]
MTRNELQQFLNKLSKTVEPYLEALNRIGIEPETLEMLNKLSVAFEKSQAIDPFMEKMLDEMKTNSNFSEALETIPYTELFRLLAKSEKIETVSILDLINQDTFKKELLQYFDQLNIGKHFKKRKALIEEALKLYELKFYAGCLCLLHTQIEGIITDYLIFKQIIRKEVPNGKSIFINNQDSKQVTGLSKKIELARDINDNLSRLDSFIFDNDKNRKFHHERNDLLHGSNINNFNAERCFILFIWIDSILESIYLDSLQNNPQTKQS